MIKKSSLIRALKQVASEYNNNSHRLSTYSCSLCQLYRDNARNNCTICPMRKAFKVCGRRQCAPLECKSYDRKKTGEKHLNELEAVKEFYFKTIKRVNKMTVKELNTPNAFDFMKAIDINIAEKYGITKKVNPWDE